MKAFKKLYLILILLGAIAFAAMGGAGCLFGVVIGLAAAYISMQFIAGVKLFKLNYRIINF